MSPDLPPPPVLPDPPVTGPFAPRRRRRVWPWVVVLVLVFAAVAVIASMQIDVDYYAVSPGPVEDLERYITADADTFQSEGDFYFLTVILEEVTLFGYVQASLDGHIDLRPQEAIRPSGVSQEELNRQNAAQMRESIDKAIFVALTELGMEPTLSGDGARVVGLVEDSPAVGVLTENDVIVRVDGLTVTTASDVVGIVGPMVPGEPLALTIERPAGDEGESERIEVDLVLGVNPDDESRGLIGVFLDTANLQTEFPIEVAIDAGGIGGPSAGMMYALGVMDLLTEDDLTKGWAIAGTGTIEFDGDVGPIGGIRQKVFAARDAGAAYVLVPEENFEEALTATGDDIELVSIDTFDDVMAFLDGLEPAPAPVRADG